MLKLFHGNNVYLGLYLLLMSNWSCYDFQHIHAITNTIHCKYSMSCVCKTKTHAHLVKCITMRKNATITNKMKHYRANPRDSYLSRRTQLLYCCYKLRCLHDWSNHKNVHWIRLHHAHTVFVLFDQLDKSRADVMLNERESVISYTF